MNMKRLSWPTLLRATLASVILYIVGGCSAPTPSGSGRPSFPYPDGGASTSDAPSIFNPDGGAGTPDALSIFNPDGLAPDIAAPVDAATPDSPSIPDVPSISDRPVPDAPVPNKPCPASCDDNNPCTIDSCDTTIGACVNSFAEEGSACDNLCLAGGQGRCSYGSCQGTPAADGMPCEDHDPCTVGDSCKDGLCFSGPAMPCPAIDSCHDPGHCERATGTCTTPNSKDGKACDDGLMCTTADQCQNGQCGGTALKCAGNTSCEAASGICKIGDSIVFPSATLTVKYPGARLTNVGALAQDGTGDLYLVGAATSALDLGSGLLFPAGMQADAGAKQNSDVLVARLDPATGKARWARLLGDQLDQTGGAVAVNRKGQVAITGMFVGSITVGSTTITNPAAVLPQAFAAAVDDTGAGLWALQPQMTSSGLALAADPTSGDFVVCGAASDRGAVGLVPLAGNPDQGDIVVARLNPGTGVPRWGRQITAPGKQTCDSVAVDMNGNVFLAGTMVSLKPGENDGGAASDVDLGFGVHLDLPVAPAAAPVTMIWAAKLEGGTGNTLKAIRFGAPNGGTQSVRQIACDAAGALLIAGGLENSAEVGPFTLTTGDQTDALLVKLDSQMDPSWARNWGGTGVTVATLVAPEPAGSLVVAGNYGGVLDLDGIALGQTSAISAAFVMRVDRSSGAVLAARGYAGPGASQSSYDLQVMGAGSDQGAIWLAGMFTQTLQMGPPAASVTATVADTAFLGRIAQ